MEKAEEVFEAIAPALEESPFARLSSTDVDLLVELLKEYHRSQKAALARAESSAAAKGTAGGDVVSDQAKPEGETHSGADEQLGGLARLSEEAVNEVERALAAVRSFLQATYPYEALSGPVRIPYQEPELAPAAKRARAEKMPSSSAGAVTVPVYSVDAFLYFEEDVADMVSRGVIRREYCCDCGSQNIALTDFITHSFSQDQVVYLSCFLHPMLLPKDGGGGRIVDVGSRLGVVQWGCCFAARAGLLPGGGAVCGVEMDDKLVAIQRQIQEKFCAPAAEPSDDGKAPLSVSVVHSDCFKGAGLTELSAADVVVLHNVFEYFCETEAGHLQCWLTLRRSVKRGALLIVSPALEETMGAFTPAAWEECCGPETDSAEGRRRSRKAATTAAEWLAEFVAPVDVSAIATAFLSFRFPSGCGCGDEACCHESSGEAGDDDDAVADLTESINNIFVYRVL